MPALAQVRARGHRVKWYVLGRPVIASNCSGNVERVDQNELSGQGSLERFCGVLERMEE